MVAQFLTCPFCGFEFDRGDTLCEHGCPLGALCNLIRCPSCAHEFPETPRSVSWLRGLLRRKPVERPEQAGNAKTLQDLQPGQRARVVCLGAHRASRHDTLAVFGLELGAEVTLVQRRPTCVVQVDETTLALDAEIAREILVQPVPPSATTDRRETADKRG